MLTKSEVEVRLRDADRTWFRHETTHQIIDSVGDRTVLLRSLQPWREISPAEVAAAYSVDAPPGKRRRNKPGSADDAAGDGSESEPARRRRKPGSDAQAEPMPGTETAPAGTQTEPEADLDEVEVL